MTDEGSLADRMRRLGEAGADPSEEQAAVERARKEKQSLAERLREMESLDASAALTAADRPDATDASDAVPAEDTDADPKTDPETGPDTETVTAEAAAIRSMDEAPDDALLRARESKSGLAARMRRLEDEGAMGGDGGPTPAADKGTESEETHGPETPSDAGSASTDDSEAEASDEVAKTRLQRLSDWFMGRFEQLRSKDPVTPIPDIPEGWEELDFQEIQPSFSYVRIRRQTATGQMLYEVIEPPLDDGQEQILSFIQDALVRGLNVDPENLDRLDRAEILERAVRQIIVDYRIRVTDIGQQRVLYYIERDFIGLGPIQVAMLDQGIEDISCDGPREGLFMFHRSFESIPSNIVFSSDADVDAFVIRLAQRSGKSISISDPILDAALPDGSRLQATLGREVTENGSTFTIRRFKPDPFTPIDLVRFGSMSKELLTYFWFIVENGSSLIFSGGTASGKTTGLNAISQFIPPQAKIVSIEDTREVNLPHKNWIKAVTRTGSSSEGTGEIGMFELLKASLRQRPEYIIVGEVRGIEASVAFQAMATGHTVYSTMHADSARSVVYRLENEPINVPRLVLQALDVIAIQGQVRYKGQRLRRIKEVVELVGMDPATRELLTHTAFTWDNTDDSFHYAGRSYLLEGIADARNWSPEQAKEEWDDRVRIIEWMIATDRTTMAEVTGVIQTYYRDKDQVMAMVDADRATDGDADGVAL